MNRKDGPAAFDALGNVTNDGVGHTYVWDAENRLSSVNGNAYVYDAFDRRMKGPSGEVLYDLSGHAVAWLDAGTGGWNIGELYADARHVATYSGGTTNFLHTDWLGTKRVMTSVTGATSETCTALSFGDGNNCAGTDWTYDNFTDDPHDNESNTEHTWFRQLSTTQGRWLSPNPVGLAAVDPTNPQSWNRYAYVGNSPLNAVDPLGLEFRSDGSWWGSITNYTFYSWVLGSGSGGDSGGGNDRGFGPGGIMFFNVDRTHLSLLLPADDGLGGGGAARGPNGGSANSRSPYIPTPTEAATRFCEDHGQFASTIRGTDIPITFSGSFTVGPVNYNTKNEITPVFPAFPWPEWLSFGAGGDVGINVPSGAAPSWSIGLGKNFGVSFFPNAQGKVTGVNLNIGLSIGPPVTVSPGSVNECGRKAGD